MAGDDPFPKRWPLWKRRQAQMSTMWLAVVKLLTPQTVQDIKKTDKLLRLQMDILMGKGEGYEQFKREEAEKASGGDGG